MWSVLIIATVGAVQITYKLRQEKCIIYVGNCTSCRRSQRFASPFCFCIAATAASYSAWIRSNYSTIELQKETVNFVRTTSTFSSTVLKYKPPCWLHFDPCHLWPNPRSQMSRSSFLWGSAPARCEWASSASRDAASGDRAWHSGQRRPYPMHHARIAALV